MPTISVVVVTPEATVLEKEAEFLVLPLYDGEVGIGQNHSPLIGRLGYGEMRLTETAGKTLRFYIDGGFVQVLDNVVSVLTGKAVPAETIDATEAEKDLDHARQLPSNSPELMEIRDRSVAQARARLRVAGRS